MNNNSYSKIAVLDTIEDKLITQSLELISFAESFQSGDLSDTLVVVPGKSAAELCETISLKYGIDTLPLENDDFYYPNPELLSRLLTYVLKEYPPEMILFTHTVRNCQCAAKLSVLLNAASVTAVESFTCDDEGCTFQRSIFNGKLKENVRLNTHLKIITVLPGAYTSGGDINPCKSNGSVVKLKASITEENEKYSGEMKYKPLSISSEPESGVKLEDADVIVSAGRGIGKEENLQLIMKTADIFSNGAVGASRPICDQRWLPFNQQVGITGKTVTPKLYMACGISGSQQHIAGMKNSQCIVAINKDPNAAIFSIADYIIIEDVLVFLDVFVKKYYERYDGVIG